MRKMAPLKLMPGKRVSSFNAFMKGLDRGTWFYLWDKAYHPRWILNMSLSVLRYQVANGRCFKAIKNKNFKEKKYHALTF